MVLRLSLRRRAPPCAVLRQDLRVYGDYTGPKGQNLRYPDRGMDLGVGPRDFACDTNKSMLGVTELSFNTLHHYRTSFWYRKSGVC